jgi:hypothetical protein
VNRHLLGTIALAFAAITASSTQAATIAAVISPVNYVLAGDGARELASLDGKPVFY